MNYKEVKYMEQLLIIEDDIGLNQGLSKALKADSRQIVSCRNLKTAKEQLLCGSASLILLDINLPDGSGLDLLQEIKEKTPDIPVILLTANDTDMDIVDGLERGAVFNKQAQQFLLRFAQFNLGISNTEHGTITISVISYEMFARIDISDTGAGIPESEQPKIFARFYRSKNAREQEGVGIGLYLARKIISGEGGYIKVTSVPGKGSTFSVFLPK